MTAKPTTAAPPAYTTIHRSAFANPQARDYAHIIRTPTMYGEGQAHCCRTLRITAHHDTSYPNQSHAKIEVWTDAGWTMVASLHASEVKSSAKMVVNGSEPIPHASFAAVETTLLAIAAAVLNIVIAQASR